MKKLTVSNRIKLGMTYDHYFVIKKDDRYYLYSNGKELYSSFSLHRFLILINHYCESISNFRTMGEVLETMSFPDPALDNPDYCDSREYSVSNAYNDTETSYGQQYFDVLSKMS